MKAMDYNGSTHRNHLHGYYLKAETVLQNAVLGLEVRQPRRRQFLGRRQCRLWHLRRSISSFKLLPQHFLQLECCSELCNQYPHEGRLLSRPSCETACWCC